MRLNFSHSPPERIEEGMQRLARALARVRGGDAVRVGAPVPAAAAAG